MMAKKYKNLSGNTWYKGERVRRLAEDRDEHESYETGMPPYDHPNRCQAKVRKRKRGADKSKPPYCPRWALAGSNLCVHHNPAARKRREELKESGISFDAIRLDHLPVFYSQKLSGTLLQLVAQQLDQHPQEQLDLTEELALVRTTALEPVEKWNLIQAVKNKDPRLAHMSDEERQKVLDTEPTVKLLLLDALNSVAEMAQKAASLQQKANDTVKIQNLNWAVAQVVRVAHETLPLTYAEDFESACSELIQVDTQGTTLTPDADVREMDSMVPQAPDG